MSRDEVIERLSKNENNYLNVIEEFMGINKNKQKNIITVNQQIYKEIRAVMDGAANNFSVHRNVVSPPSAAATAARGGDGGHKWR